MLHVFVVTHNCGAPGAGGTFLDANVTIKSDLHAFGKLTCNNGGVPVTVDMPPINDTNTEVTTNLFYTGDKNGVTGTDCFFFVSEMNEQSITTTNLHCMTCFMIKLLNQEIFWHQQFTMQPFFITKVEM